MKAFFYKYRIPLIEWYFAGASCFFCVLVLNMNILSTAVVLGFVNTYLTRPIVFALSYASQEDQDAYMAEKPKVWKEIAKSMLISLSIYGIYYVVNEYFFHAQINPYLFGILFWLFDHIMRKLINKWH